MIDQAFNNVGELLETRAREYPEKQFLFSESSGRVFSYTEFDKAVNHAALLLVSLGARKGERVSMLLTNSVEYLIFYFACFKIGAWAGPGPEWLGPFWFLLKAMFLFLLITWVRWSFVRIRVDQILALSWKALLPATLSLLVATAFVVVWRT